MPTDPPLAATPSVVDPVASAPVMHAAVDGISLGYRVVGPLGAAAAAATAPGAAAAAAAPGAAAAAAAPGAAAVTMPTAAPARPLLLVMGSSATMAMWPVPLVTALAQGRTVIMFDHRGMGASAFEGPAYPFTALADDAAGLLRALGLAPADVLGWSMGGSVAIDLAVRHPGALARLVSYAGSPGGVEAVPPTPDALAALTDTAASDRERGERLLALLFPPAYRAAHPDFWRSVPIPSDPPSPAAIGMQNAAIGSWPGDWDALPGIAVPALFVTGEEDVIAPPENAARMAARVPGAQLVRVPGAGHGLMYQDPAGLAASVLRFLAGGSSPA